MQVVNVRVANIRPTYNNLQEWCANPNHVYVGRKGIVFINGERYPPQNSIFANPFKGENAIELYRDYIVDKINSNEIIAGKTYEQHLLELDGKILGCWCKPKPCHSDILIEILEDIKSRYE